MELMFWSLMQNSVTRGMWPNCFLENTLKEFCPNSISAPPRGSNAISQDNVAIIVKEGIQADNVQCCLEVRNKLNKRSELSLL